MAAHLVLVLVLLFVVTTSSYKPKAPSFQIRSGWNLAGLFFEWMLSDWRSWISDTTSYFQAGGHDSISWEASSSPQSSENMMLIMVGVT